MYTTPNISVHTVFGSPITRFDIYNKNTGLGDGFHPPAPETSSANDSPNTTPKPHLSTFFAPSCASYFVRWGINYTNKSCQWGWPYTPEYEVYTPPFVMREGAVYINTTEDASGRTIENWQWKDPNRRPTPQIEPDPESERRLCLCRTTATPSGLLK